MLPSCPIHTLASAYLVTGRLHDKSSAYYPPLQGYLQLKPLSLCEHRGKLARSSLPSLARTTTLFVQSRARRRLQANIYRRMKGSSGWYRWPPSSLLSPTISYGDCRGRMHFWNPTETVWEKNEVVCHDCKYTRDLEYSNKQTNKL